MIIVAVVLAEEITLPLKITYIKKRINNTKILIEEFRIDGVSSVYVD